MRLGESGQKTTRCEDDDKTKNKEGHCDLCQGFQASLPMQTFPAGASLLNVHKVGPGCSKGRSSSEEGQCVLLGTIK